MPTNLVSAMMMSAAGMQAEGTRLRVIAENIANADSTSQTPGGEPYRRKVISFQNVLDRNNDINIVKVNKIGSDNSDFVMKYNPSHPASNADGYVLMANVNPLIELADMREAQRSYEANVNSIQSSKSMLLKTLDILR